MNGTATIEVPSKNTFLPEPTRVACFCKAQKEARISSCRFYKTHSPPKHIRTPHPAKPTAQPLANGHAPRGLLLRRFPAHGAILETQERFAFCSPSSPKAARGGAAHSSCTRNLYRSRIGALRNNRESCPPESSVYTHRLRRSELLRIQTISHRTTRGERRPRERPRHDPPQQPNPQTAVKSSSSSRSAPPPQPQPQPQPRKRSSAY